MRQVTAVTLSQGVNDKNKTETLCHRSYILNTSTPLHNTQIIISLQAERDVNKQVLIERVEVDRKGRWRHMEVKNIELPLCIKDV